MGFKNKKNRVHPTGNNKKQQRKERKRRRLARLIQRINPFSCCTGDGVPKNVDNQEPCVVEDGCTYQKLMKPTGSLHCPSPARMDSGISKTSPIVKLAVKPTNKYPHFARSPVHPSRAPTNMTLPATSSSCVPPLHPPLDQTCPPTMTLSIHLRVILNIFLPLMVPQSFKSHGAATSTSMHQFNRQNLSND
ncbi:hypothetical protein BSL78_12010 [Apostichopus japonicus]|uniref:Uncharacterized protein n=1 Tax=Stichopus japonicus TaxID=307972 RepID=A0A2G8KSW8_STIJA|nr:hypothetical protein BSL78_12010 [Apostichopus japonicus]